MFRTVLCTVCLLAGTCQTASSQGSPTSEPKSTSTAVKYSAYGTAMPVVVGGAVVLASYSRGEIPDENLAAAVIGINLGVLGAVVGPGLGHAYAGRWVHLVKGSLFRRVGAAFIAAGIVPELSGMEGWGDSDQENGGDEGGNGGSILIGSVIYLWSAIHDFRTLDDAVEWYNQQHAGITVSVSPTYFASENALCVVVSVGF
jgi:hypothetical protein